MLVLPIGKVIPLPMPDRVEPSMLGISCGNEPFSERVYLITFHYHDFAFRNYFLHTITNTIEVEATR
jgi:hypothetical protein